MINPKDLKKICAEYNIGEYISIKEVLDGVLNENYIVHTTTGNYFIKSVREKSKNKLHIIHEVESYMKSCGIPAIAMLATKTDAIFVPSDTSVYTLYLFIENRKKSQSEYNEQDYFTLGEMLGKIHVIGNGDIPSYLKLKEFKRSSFEVALGKLEGYKKDILSKNILDDSDQLFLKYIDLKLHVALKIKDVSIVNDTLIHGDFHPGNILFDTEMGIIGVCDWEKSEYAPRAYELARSLLYICYRNGYNTSDILTHVASFLNGYLSKISINTEEMIAGLYLRIRQIALSSWIEEKYYQGNDVRGNQFIENEIHLMEIAVHGTLFKDIENIISKITKN